jgi:hypothetical protein
MVGAWFKIIPAVISAGFLTTPGLSTNSYTIQTSVPSEEEIVVVGSRFHGAKVDYRLKRNQVIYCGPRDQRQDASLIYKVCEQVRNCVFNGARSKVEISQCVNEKLR